VLFNSIMDGSVKEIELASSSCNGEEGGRGCRNKRKLSEPICCPVCSVTLRISEVQSHFVLEIDKLSKIPSTKHKSNGRNAPSSSNTSDNNADKTWETFQKVRLNRQNRHRSKTKKRKAEEIVCPICNKEAPEEITLHVEKCLRRTERNESESDESIDVEAFEEYEWAGQSRVRITSLLPGGVINLGTSISMTEEDEDLNVDGDDAQTYGSPQYSERDVILLPGDPENIALRKAVIGEDPKRMQPEENDGLTAQPKGDPLVEVLKNRIRELESKEKNREEIYKCLICMERYRTPVISVCCWHVHCEQCWLQTLGAKKLCPQCNMITSPADLRKIYM
jgi:hypothetical protein